MGFKKLAGYLILVTTFFIGTAALAQGTGTIHGTVTDPSGLAVPGAKVTATLEQRGITRMVQSNSAGGYVLPLMPVGTYTVVVEGLGFKQFRQEGVTLNANENVRIDAKLEMGAVSDQVTVTAEAPLVDSRSSVLGTLIDARRVLELPMNGRNVIGLAVLLPGVSQLSVPQAFTRDVDGPTVSVSGSRGNQNLFLFDGAPFNAIFRNTGLNYPPPDALQEVKVLTNSFAAEYGHSAGSVFNVVTKSGSNEIHGSVWEFLRNHSLNARNFFAPPQLVPKKPQLIQNQYGAAAGGPIKKNKLFVFGSYEALKIRPASLSASAFPLTAAERTGDFSASSSPVRDPLTGVPFPGNRIPANRIDSVSGNVLSRSLMPLPNQPDGGLRTTYPSPRDNNNVLVRVDRNLGRHTLDGHYNFNQIDEKTFDGNVPSYLPLSRGARLQSITLGDTFNVATTFLNQARLSFNRYINTIEVTNHVHLSDLGAKVPIVGDGRKIPPNLNISGRITLGNDSNLDDTTVNETIQFSEGVLWTKGVHSVKAGLEVLKHRWLERSYFSSEGRLDFTGAFSGNPAADFLLGKAAVYRLSSPVSEEEKLQTATYAYIQDDWRMHPRLTLNLGLRYELSPPWVHPKDYATTFVLGLQSQKIPSAPKGIVFPGDPGVPRGLRKTDKNNFSPRLGFAWDPYGNGRTSVRAAYGIFYETMNADSFPTFNGPPYRNTYSINAPATLSDPLAGQPPIPLVVDLSNPRFLPFTEFPFPDLNMATPYVHHFHFTLQREVVKDMVVQIAYVAKLGRHLLVGISKNPAVFAPGATLGNIDQRRVIPGFGNLRGSSSISESSYHALQLESYKRFSHGFSLQWAYTFSRSIDQFSEISLGAGVPNPLNLSAEKGLSAFHAKHIFSLSWLWDLPSLASSHALVRGIAGGWELTGLVTARSGLPINITTGSDNALSGTPAQRPNLVGNPALSGSRSRGEKVLAWFNRAAFGPPATGTYGNVGRNLLIGPGASDVNLGLFKNFELPGREGLKLQFRSEFFDVLNRPNLGNPVSSLSAGTRMGQITSAGGSRVIQFALKMLF
ncbi:MAG TPA: TonB-dependent receptor [Acidobacteriota bacterium]|jgi:hypothetical protein